jgi:hypothetical protein
MQDRVLSFLDACLSCYPRKLGYKYTDGYVVCRACDTTYSVFKLEKGIGGCYPIGRSQKISDSLRRLIEERGGKVLLRKRVEKILVKDHAAYGVKTADGAYLGNVWDISVQLGEIYPKSSEIIISKGVFSKKDLDGLDLADHVNAVGILFNHPNDAAQVAFDGFQPA